MSQFNTQPQQQSQLSQWNQSSYTYESKAQSIIESIEKKFQKYFQIPKENSEYLIENREKIKKLHTQIIRQNQSFTQANIKRQIIDQTKLISLNDQQQIINQKRIFCQQRLQHFLLKYKSQNNIIAYYPQQNQQSIGQLKFQSTQNKEFINQKSQTKQSKLLQQRLNNVYKQIQKLKVNKFEENQQIQYEIKSMNLDSKNNKSQKQIKVDKVKSRKTDPIQSKITIKLKNLNDSKNSKIKTLPSPKNINSLKISNKRQIISPIYSSINCPQKNNPANHNQKSKQIKSVKYINKQINKTNKQFKKQHITKKPQKRLINLTKSILEQTNDLQKRLEEVQKRINLEQTKKNFNNLHIKNNTINNKTYKPIYKIKSQNVITFQTRPCINKL